MKTHKSNILVAFALLVGVLTTSCGKKASVSDEFKPYVNSFVGGARVHNKPLSNSPDSLTVEFASLPPNINGKCYFGSNLVQIDKARWEASTQTSKNTLMKHELGHCLLGRAHDDRMLDADTPASIMHPYLLLDYVYESQSNYYENELYK